MQLICFRKQRPPKGPQSFPGTDDDRVQCPHQDVLLDHCVRGPGATSGELRPLSRHHTLASGKLAGASTVLDNLRHTCTPQNSALLEVLLLLVPYTATSWHLCNARVQYTN